VRSPQNAGVAGYRPGLLPAARRRRHVIWAIAALAVMGIVPVPAAGAAAAPPPPPAPGVTPGAVYVSPTENDVFYTATDRTVWVKNLDNGVLARVGNGLLVSAPSAIYDGSSVVVFGEGTDHKLWRTVRQATGGYGNWELLGGAITARPAAVAATLEPSVYYVFVRGTDGAVYQAAGTSSTHGTASFTRVGGRVLAGTGPAAAYEKIGPAAHGQAPDPPADESTWVAVAGTNRALYVAQVGAFPISGQWQSAGGQTTASPAMTLYQANGSVLAVVRGTDNAAYYRSVQGAGGWMSIGGRLSSGLVATIDGQTGTAYVYALGTDNQVYQKTANLAASRPAFSPTWKKVTG
jgi:hypothetical protein